MQYTKERFGSQVKHQTGCSLHDAIHAPLSMFEEKYIPYEQIITEVHDQ